MSLPAYCAILALRMGSAKDNVVLSMWLQAPVPYLNRAIAREALGVKAGSSGDEEAATTLYVKALQVSLSPDLLHTHITIISDASQSPS